jgi:hypothetical protein
MKGSGDRRARINIQMILQGCQIEKTQAVELIPVR